MPSDPTISPDARCQVPPEGWWCSREPGHDGPCAARIDPETDKAGGLWYSRWWGAMERVEALERELAHLRTPTMMLMTQEWLDKKIGADPVAEVEACTPAGEAGEMVIGLYQVAYVLKSVANGDDQSEVAGKCAAIVEETITRITATDTEAMRLLLRELRPYVDAAHAGIDTAEQRNAIRARIDAALARGA